MSNLRKNYSEVYDKYVKKIYRFVLLKVNSAEIAEDLTSEVFMRGWQSFKGQGPDKIENIQAFLYQIANSSLFTSPMNLTPVIPWAFTQIFSLE